MHRIAVERYRRNRAAFIRHCDITLALLAAPINVFFHDSGDFNPDLMPCLLIGLLIADYRLALREAPRQEPVDENDFGDIEPGESDRIGTRSTAEREGRRPTPHTAR